MNIDRELISQLREALSGGLTLAMRHVEVKHRKAIYAAPDALDKLEAQPDTDAAAKAVPREPTPEMMQAAYKIPSNLGVNELRVREWLEEDARQTWRAMWDAAMKEEK